LIGRSKGLTALCRGTVLEPRGWVNDVCLYIIFHVHSRIMSWFGFCAVGHLAGLTNSIRINFSRIFSYVVIYK
jgi:hypothetical protein